MNCTHEPKTHCQPDGLGNLNEHSLCEACAKEFTKICAEKVRVESAIRNKKIEVVKVKPIKKKTVVRKKLLSRWT